MLYKCLGDRVLRSVLVPGTLFKGRLDAAALQRCNGPQPTFTCYSKIAASDSDFPC